MGVMITSLKTLFVFSIIVVGLIKGKWYLVKTKGRGYEHKSEEEWTDYKDTEEGADNNTTEKNPAIGLVEKTPDKVLNEATTKVGKLNKTEVVKKKNSAVISGLLVPKEKKTTIIPVEARLCDPESLKIWKENHEAKNAQEIEESCRQTIPDPISGKSNGISWKDQKYWKHLDKQLQNDKLLSYFPKGERPPDLSLLFKASRKKFAEKYLVHGTMDHLQAKIAFFTDHERVNKQLLVSAVSLAMLTRNDTSQDVPNPIEVDDVFFRKQQENGTSESGGEDYSLYIPRSVHDLSTNYNPLSNDPDERKLHYYREDSLFHAFHSLLHTLQQNHPRQYELFWYAHQQMLRRYGLERLSVGVSPVEPLTMAELQKPLGPGYKVGFYGWTGLLNRKDNCRINTKSLERTYKKVRRVMEGDIPFETFGLTLDGFHNDGHNEISKQCSNNGVSVMSYSAVSARDPIFYRWHMFFENIVQEFRDTKNNKYGLADFQLSNGIEVTGVKTILNKDVLSVKKDVQNLLITHWKTKSIRHDEKTPIKYTTLSHKDFKYQIHINNPKNVKKKVSIRLWLGILENKNDYSSYNVDTMIEMDQFVHNLSGGQEEVISRDSRQSAGTMKHFGKTIKSQMWEIRRRREIGTWCGFPHHLLLPRSKDYDPNDENLGGQDFVLYAFVTDVDDDVTAGSDNVEHMICGHKDISKKLDGKPFGYPFDKKLDFQLSDSIKSVAANTVKIIFSPVTKLREIGRKLSYDKICEDKELSCPRWADRGYCRGKYAEYLKTNCKKSCKHC